MRVIWLFSLCLGFFLVLQGIYQIVSSMFLLIISVIDNPDTLKYIFSYGLEKLPQIIVGWLLVKRARRELASLTGAAAGAGKGF